MIPLAPHLTAFLQRRLPIERKASPNTCDTYAYAFQLLLQYMSRRIGLPPSGLALEHLDAPCILQFLEHLETERHNRPPTCNARLAAIKSFMRFLEYRVPAVLDQIARVLAIPVQKTDSRLVRHLNDDETRAILDSPDPATYLGVRDRAMLIVAIAGGLRVSELVGLVLNDVSFDGKYVDIVVRGKGRKERGLRLWKQVADALRAWLAIRGTVTTPELFLNSRRQAMTRSGFELVLERHAGVARVACASLATKRISPHVLRHTCAVNTLRATGDVRKVALWLGHSNPATTEIYLQVDPVQKQDFLESHVPPSLRPGKFRPPDRVIASLRGA